MQYPGQNGRWELRFSVTMRFVVGVAFAIQLLLICLAEAAPIAEKDAHHQTAPPVVRLPVVSEDRGSLASHTVSGVRPARFTTQPVVVPGTQVRRPTIARLDPTTRNPDPGMTPLQRRGARDRDASELVSPGAIRQRDMIPTAPRPDNAFPIDLVTALQLAGASNLQIAMARERVREAMAELAQAKVLWVPSLQAGVGYNRHEGQIQDTGGQVLDVSRNSLFVGGGAVASSTPPLAGGSNGPARLGLDLSLSDVLFEPLAARQVARTAQFNSRATFNDSLLRVSLLYLLLTQAQAQVAIAQEAVGHAHELVRITGDFSQAGRGLEADAQRARAERAHWQQQLFFAREDVGVVSAELVRQLRLDPTVVLFPADAPLGPLELVDRDTPLDRLIGMAVAQRPEMSRERAAVGESVARVRQERWRPWLPQLHLGVDAGGFGGGTGAFFGDFSDRLDFDALAVWQVRNLGLGTQAQRARVRSLNQQARINFAKSRDLIAAEVAKGFRRLQARWQRIEAAKSQVRAAARALPLNFEGVLGGELRAIEVKQAIADLADARKAYLEAVVAYNQAQFELLRAIGAPPSTSPFEPLPTEALPDAAGATTNAVGGAIVVPANPG